MCLTFPCSIHAAFKVFAALLIGKNVVKSDAATIKGIKLPFELLVF